MFITLTAFKIKVKQSTMLNSSGGYDFGRITRDAKDVEATGLYK